jgi:hypothetical protein
MALFIGDDVTEDTLKNLKLNEMVFFDKGTKMYIKVPGGFTLVIYKSYPQEDGTKQHIVNSLFIPYPEEWK